MGNIRVHDATTDRVAAIDKRAREIIDKWMNQCADELQRLEPDISPSEGITVSAYMTAGYSLYLNLTELIQKLGGEVYPLPQDTPNPEDQS